MATTSKGNILVYTRTGSERHAGGSRIFTHGGSRLFEFDRTGKFVREIGQGVYGFLFAQAVKVDPKDNIWVVDRGSNMVIKFTPDGRVAMTLSRKPESVNELDRPLPAAGRTRARQRRGRARRQFQSSDRRRVGQRRQHLRRRRLRQLARREVRPERQVREVLGHARHRNRASSICRSPSPWTRRTTSTSPIAATSASRSSTPRAR